MNYSQQPPPQLQLNLQLWDDDTPFLQPTLCPPSSPPPSEPHLNRQPSLPSHLPQQHHVQQHQHHQQQLQCVTPLLRSFSTTLPLYPLPPPSSYPIAPGPNPRPDQHPPHLNNFHHYHHQQQQQLKQGNYLQLQRQNSLCAQQQQEPFPATIMPFYSGPMDGARPSPGFGNQLPLRPIPPHLQRPPMDQPMQGQPRQANPLDDLTESEKEYLSDLKILLQRVSAGWTQDDFPPKEVDEMLRNIEEIHATNRKLMRRLDEVAESQDHDVELVLALIWFVDIIEAPYSNYCRTHVPLLDNWPEIINNSRLQNILTAIAAEQVQHVTLDSFLMKPIDRLHYYRRLYMRLLDSSDRGNPDFEALEAAFLRIDSILRLVTVDVPGTSRHPASPALSGISSMSALRHALPSPPISDPTKHSPNFPPQNQPMMSPALPPSPMSPGMSPRQRQQPNSNSLDAMMELERTLDTTKVFDLFTMQPKACALSLGSAERSIIIRGDYCFTVSTDDNAEDRFEDGHLLLLSDLLLICRTKTQDEISRNIDGNISTHWLLFPPLAVRHVIATDVTQADQVPVIELTIVNRVKTRIWILEDRLKAAWIHEINSAQQFDSSKTVQQQQQQQQGGHLNRNFTQTRPMRPMGPGSPLSPTFQGGPPPQHFNNGPLSPPMPGRPNGPLSPTFQGHPGGPGSPMLRPRPSMGGRPPMGGPMGGPMGAPMGGPTGGPMHSPGFRPQMAPGRPGMLHHYGGGSMHGRPRPMQRGMSMRRANTMGGPRGRILQKGDVAAPKEVMYKSKPCDVFQWRDDMWDPLVEDDDCFVELRLTMSNRLVMAVITADQGQLVLNAWIVGSTTFRRASETDVSVSMDMGASVQWFLVALNSGREAEEFCMSFQRTKDRAMYDPSLQKSSSSPVLSRGDSLASTVTQQSAREKPVKQTLNTMYPPSECKLLLQAGDHGQWISLGAARVEIKMEKPSGHVRLFVGLISGNKRVLDSVIVQCDCLELVGPKKLAITLQNPQEKMSIIYMLQFKDEAMTTKIFEGLSLNENE